MRLLRSCRRGRGILCLVDWEAMVLRCGHGFHSGSSWILISFALSIRNTLTSLVDSLSTHSPDLSASEPSLPFLGSLTKKLTSEYHLIERVSAKFLNPPLTSVSCFQAAAITTCVLKNPHPEDSSLIYYCSINLF